MQKSFYFGTFGLNTHQRIMILQRSDNVNDVWILSNLTCFVY